MQLLDSDGSFCNSTYTYLTRVDGQAIILVVDGGTVDGDVGTLTNVKGIGVVALARTGGVVNGHVSDGQVVSQNAEALDRGVVDLQAGDAGLVELVSLEELGLGLATVATLAVPPASTVAVDLGTGGLLDGDVGTGHGDQGTLPFLVAEGGFTLEDDL